MCYLNSKVSITHHPSKKQRLRAYKMLVTNNREREREGRDIGVERSNTDLRQTKMDFISEKDELRLYC